MSSEAVAKDQPKDAPRRGRRGGGRAGNVRGKGAAIAQLPWSLPVNRDRPTEPLDEAGVCELKRLWIREAFRGLGLGRRLTETALAAAEAAGYARICLDTLPMMGEAQALYRSLGFEEIAPYYHNPVEGVRYLEKTLSTSGARSG